MSNSTSFIACVLSTYIPVLGILSTAKMAENCSKGTISEPFDLEAFLRVECEECEEDAQLIGTITSNPLNIWTQLDDQPVANSTVVINISPDNIIEETKTEANKMDTVVEAKAETKGDTMAEEPKTAEVKPPETICAKKHETLMKEKDVQIEALKKELEVTKATVTKFEDEKKAVLLDTLKKEGIDSEPYKAETIPVIEKVLNAVVAFKKKADEAPEVNSGANVKATEQKTDESGAVMQKAAEESKPKVDEILERAWARAEADYGLKRPKPKGE